MFDRLRDVTSLLSSCLESDSGLDDAGRIDAIRGAEELVCVLTAAQALLAAELDESQRARHEAAEVPAAQRGRGVAAQVALARRESPHRGQRHLGLAKVVRSELPHTWTAWRTGRITEWKATLVARETACLSRQDRALVDAEVAGDASRLEAMSLRELVGACRRLAYEVDAESFVARRRRAESERCVTLRPAPDCMTWLTALVPVKDGVGAYAALRRRADAARAEGDPRGQGQVMADTLVSSILGAAAEPGTGVPGPHVRLNLVMTDTALFGEDEQPAHLDGHGPIPAELAREIVVGACARNEAVWVRRLYTSPETGELVSTDVKARLFPRGMSRFVRLRDQACRTPWCDAPIRHVDHARSHGAGGPTSLVNAQGLCEACDYAKQAPGWRAGPTTGVSPPGIETKTPTGHHHVTRPPALARIRRAHVSVDFVLAG